MMEVYIGSVELLKLSIGTERKKNPELMPKLPHNTIVSCLVVSTGR